VIVFVIAVVVSLGAALGAPLGLFLVRRWTIRHNRRPNRIASLVGAVLTSSVAGAAVWLVLFAVAPRPTQEELRTAAKQSQKSPPIKLPAWYSKAFPQTARTDSATQQLIQSRGFMTATLVFGAVFLGLFCGVIGGSLGWCAAVLLRVAWPGQVRPDTLP
jgi:MFS family permease